MNLLFFYPEPQKSMSRRVIMVKSGGGGELCQKISFLSFKSDTQTIPHPDVN
jgi:hypothetical protein